MPKMFGSNEFLYDRFEKTKSAVKRAPYITGGVVGILFLICLLAIFHHSGTEDEPSPLIVSNSKSQEMERPSPMTLKYFTIFDAVAKGETKDVKALIEKGVNLNKQNELGETALHLAIKRGSESIAKLLLENGANGNVQDNNGYSPLALAVKNDRQDIAHLILDDVNFGIASWNKDILGHKACNVSDKLANAFMKKGVNITIDAEDTLLQAIRNDDVSKTQLILDNCIGDYNGNKGILPLTAAAQGCKVKVATMLIAKGANVDQSNPDGWSAIHVSTYDGCKEMVKLLIDNHCDVNSRTKYGFTPLCIAKRQNYHEIEEMLKQANATVLCSF